MSDDQATRPQPGSTATVPPLTHAPRDDAGAHAAQPVPDPVDDRSVSPTGADRGRPDAEHGAYGMVRRDVAPRLTERQIRGVEPLPPGERRA